MSILLTKFTWLVINPIALTQRGLDMILLRTSTGLIHADFTARTSLIGVLYTLSNLYQYMRNFILFQYLSLDLLEEEIEDERTLNTKVVSKWQPILLPCNSFSVIITVHIFFFYTRMTTFTSPLIIHYIITVDLKKREEPYQKKNLTPTVMYFLLTSRPHKWHFVLHF